MPTATSKDGTVLTYSTIGSGAAIVLVHGTFSSVDSHTELAHELSSNFTVITYNRRTLILSAADPKASPPASYALETEVDDLVAILQGSKASYFFGISSGAVIALQATLLHPNLVTKCAVWEPILLIGNSIDTNFITRYSQEIHDGRTDAALVTAMLGTQLGPSIFQIFPRGLLEWLTRKGIAVQERSKKEGEVTLVDLAPPSGYDFKILEGVGDDVVRFKGIECEVLIMGSLASPAYIKTGVAALEKVLTKVERADIKGSGHGAVLNKAQGGKPGVIAKELKTFFGP